MLKWGKNKEELFPKYTNRGGALFEKYNSAIIITKDDIRVKTNKEILEENHSLFNSYLK